jgi:hypothetical protein
LAEGTGRAEWGPHMPPVIRRDSWPFDGFRDCARDCAREEPNPPSSSQRQPSEKGKSPQQAVNLPRGSLVLVGLMRPLLCHLSYAAVPGAEQKTYRVTRQASSDPRPRGARLCP